MNEFSSQNNDEEVWKAKTLESYIVIPKCFMYGGYLLVYQRKFEFVFFWIYLIAIHTYTVQQLWMYFFQRQDIFLD